MSMFRIDGLASGMDTYQMVTDLMKAHRKPVDKLLEQRQVLEWQREDFRTLNSLLLNFRTNTVADMRLDAGLAMTSAASSNAAVATATASGAATDMTYNLHVDSLATHSYRTSKALSAENEKIDAHASLLSQIDAGLFKDGLDFGWYESETTTITGDGNQTEFTPDMDNHKLARVNSVKGGDTNYTVYTDQAAFNAAKEDGKTNIVLVDRENSTLTFAEAPDENAEITVDYDRYTGERDDNRHFYFEITTHDYDGKAITRGFDVDADRTSLDQLLRQISADKELGVNAFYDASADQVSLATTRTGRNAGGDDELQITGFLAGGTEISGENAKVSVNGMDINRPTNDFVLNNVLFSLRGSGDATIAVGRDTDAMVDKIKHFVQEYNGLLDILNGKLNEERFRDYPPLVNEDDQQGLTDRQIDQWEQKARSGLLRHDSMLSGVVTRLRSEVYTKVDGLDADMNHLAHMGITVGSFYDRGKLVIDESKLRAAVEQDPDGVAKIFNHRSTDPAEQGVAQRLYGSLDNAIKQVTARAGAATSPLSADQSWIGRQISDLDKRVDQAEVRLEKMEDRYWRQFAAMEQALNRMNAQSAWLEQQLGGMM